MGEESSVLETFSRLACQRQSEMALASPCVLRHHAALMYPLVGPTGTGLRSRLRFVKV